MFIIEIPGIGEVEVDSKEALQKLQKQLSAYYKHLAEIAERKDKMPEQMLEALQKLLLSNDALVKAMIAEMREIKPQVTVEAPQVTVQAPAPVAETKQIIKPIKKIIISKVERDFKGQLKAGTEIDVVR